MNLTSDEKGRIKRRMRKPLVTGLGLSTVQTLKRSSAPKRASHWLSMRDIEAKFFKQ
jgi:hypothetical protein